MANIDLKLQATASGRTTTLTMTNVNPNVSNETLLDFSKKVNQLTTNTYVKTQKQTTVTLDTDAEDTRPVPTITFNVGGNPITKISDLSGTQDVHLAMVTNSDYTGAPTVAMEARLGATMTHVDALSYNAGTYSIRIGDITTNMPAITFTIPETANYQGASATLPY